MFLFKIISLRVIEAPEHRGRSILVAVLGLSRRFQGLKGPPVRPKNGETRTGHPQCGRNQFSKRAVNWSGSALMAPQ
jgi:hypothetical protein